MHEKVFNITNPRGNTNQKHSYHLTLQRMAITKKTKNIKYKYREGYREKEPFYFVEGKVN
jgi:hypothetical protein